ncbi:MAG: molybdenum cofactor guanylyltransferase MobA [Gammaproteobacteria bacterium]
MTVYPRSDITGVILAGGRASRMGGQDKGLIEIGGRPMVEYALASLAPQCGAIVINANRNLARYHSYGWPVIPDAIEDYQGPLAGIASVMSRADTAYIVTAPCDSPLLPHDLGERLWSALTREHAEIAVASSADRMQPVFSMLKRELLSSLTDYLQQGERKIDRWYALHRVAIADFADCPDAFLNVNTPEERAALEARLAT